MDNEVLDIILAYLSSENTKRSGQNVYFSKALKSGISHWWLKGWIVQTHRKRSRVSWKGLEESDLSPEGTVADQSEVVGESLHQEGNTCNTKISQEGLKEWFATLTILESPGECVKFPNPSPNCRPILLESPRVGPRQHVWKLPC